jgi:hypothetical protein
MTRSTRKRRGITVVETALVLGVFLLLLFGLFEYCRFLFVLHLTNNAARDGARYAAVRVSCPADQVAPTQAAIVQYTQDRMGGAQKQIEGFAVAVYPCDPTGLAQTPPVIRSKSVNGSAPYPDPFTGGAANPAWNAVSFPDRVAVTIKGTYKPITPVLLLMPDAIDIRVTAVVGSEG